MAKTRILFAVFLLIALPQSALLQAANGSVAPAPEELSYIEAAKLGVRDRVAFWLNKGVGVDDGQGGPFTALFFAAAKNHVAIASDLIDAGADVDTAGRGGWTPLMVAAFHGHTSVLELLLDAGANTALKSADGYTALMYAAAYGQDGAAAALLARGASANASTSRLANMPGKSVLSLAVAAREYALVRRLLGAGASTFEPALDVLPTLFIAAAQDDHLMMTLLFEAGAKAGVIDGAGNTVLHYVINRSAAPTIDLLLARGVDADATNGKGETALVQVAAYGNIDNMMLLYRRASPAQRQRAFFSAVESGVYTSVAALLDQGMIVSATDASGYTALMLASLHRHEKVVALLLERGADPGQKDRSGMTALQHAQNVSPVNPQVVELLRAAI